MSRSSSALESNDHILSNINSYSMKIFIQSIVCTLLIIMSNNDTEAQTQEILNLKSESVTVESDYLDIKLETWDRDYIEIRSEVKINMGRDDDKHQLEFNNTNNGIEIFSSIDTKNIEQMVITTDKEGNKTYTNAKDWDDNNDGKEFHSMNIGYEIDGLLTIFIPKNMDLNLHTTYGDVYMHGGYQAILVHSTYGLIEAKLEDINKMKNVSIKSTYDVVDLTLDKNSDASLNLQTSYGSVYSDLPFQSKNVKKNKHNHGCGHHSEKYILNNGSVNIDLVATYDNIYVRSN